ncbi:aspartate carbamoyltransferase [Candidatus Uhrbacteria bacterium CG_4_9_14_3_um_filter_50_9]|uniref:Aspartate carbamoyltransferase n=1 Tax=Candidatus Uhrbacteria bacterium CG_4_9_14_3_um_filter_50_9 TaxID=1975035 RepID=A0A2M7XCI1_9BACT|nr:MAG: aspartate carbamoyltransferase [Candidatus Uhrbacteria bacterium CG_4_9_14_3_um_filter_50_9]
MQESVLITSLILFVLFYTVILPVALTWGIPPGGPVSEIQHVISVDQFTPEWIAELFERAKYWKRSLCRPGGVASAVLSSRMMISLFYEPSTRTRLSFESAMNRLGGRVIGTEDAEQFSSATKGETLEDTIHVVSGYGDVIVLRHKERGAAVRAAAVSTVPIINAGDGDGEHPTQALLDLFTIQETAGPPKDQHVVFVGDLNKGRTVHSLARLLSKYGTSMSFVSPEHLAIPEHLCGELGLSSACEYRSLDVVIERATVIYMTRTQNERHHEGQVGAGDGSDYGLTRELVAWMRHDTVVLHPLPRNSEIPTWFDQDPRAHYIDQAHRGVPLRMALLEMLLNPLPE